MGRFIREAAAAVAVLAFGIGGVQARAEAAATVFACDAPGGRICYFTVFSEGATRSFSVPPGQRRAVAGLTPLKDSYDVSYGAPNFGDANRCRQMAAMSRGCVRKMVDADYND